MIMDGLGKIRKVEMRSVLVAEFFRNARNDDLPESGGQRARALLNESRKRCFFHSNPVQQRVLVRSLLERRKDQRCIFTCPDLESTSAWTAR